MIKTVAKRRVWKQMNKAVQQIQDEYVMRLNGDGVYIKGVDPAHVAMIEVRVPLSALKHDHVGDITESIGVDAERVALIVNNCMPNEDITAQYDGKRIRFDGVLMDGQPCTYTTNTVSTEGFPDPKVPNLGLPVAFLATVSHMRNCLKILEKISDHIELVEEDGIVSVKAWGDTEEASMVIGTSTGGTEKKHRSLFPMDYIVNHFKSLQDVDSVRITMGQDLPVKIEAVTIDKVIINYMLAPRIDN